MRYSPDVGAALRSPVCNVHLRIDASAIALGVENGTATLGFATQLPLAEETDQVGDAAVAVMFKVMRSLCGSKWKAIEVQLARREPGDADPYRRYFRVPRRFDGECDVVVFSATWLRFGLPAIDPEVRRLLQRAGRRGCGS